MSFFRPCIDLHEGRVKQIIGSTLTDGRDPETNFVSNESPHDIAERYRKDNLFGGHVIRLGPGNTAAALEALRAFPGGLQVGGGITPENAGEFLDAGASHVIVTSYVFRDGRVDRQRLEALLRAVGRERLVLDLSCRLKDGAYFVVTDRWQVFTESLIDRELLHSMAESCDEFLVHAVDVEGKREGIDAELVEILAHDSPIPVTYAGGVRSLDDMRRVHEAGAGRVAVTVGSALDIFGGDLPYHEAVALSRRLTGSGRH